MSNYYRNPHEYDKPLSFEERRLRIITASLGDMERSVDASYPGLRDPIAMPERPINTNQLSTVAINASQQAETSPAVTAETPAEATLSLVDEPETPGKSDAYLQALQDIDDIYREAA